MTINPDRTKNYYWHEGRIYGTGQPGVGLR